MNVDPFALGALVVSMAALVVAILDWNQIGREEPWTLTKLQNDIWMLERVHRSPVVVLTLLNFHGSAVQVLNDAAIPTGIYRRGRKEILRISPSQLGTSLTVQYRRHRWWRPLVNRLCQKQAFAYPLHWHTPEQMRKASQWHSPLY